MSGEDHTAMDRLLRLPAEELFASIATFDRVNERKRKARGDNTPPNG